MGRVRAAPGDPRIIDLDLLLYGEEVIDEPGLTLPHPGMCDRAFVLTPLAEIAPECGASGERSDHQRPQRQGG